LKKLKEIEENGKLMTTEGKFKKENRSRKRRRKRRKRRRSRRKKRKI